MQVWLREHDRCGSRSGAAPDSARNRTCRRATLVPPAMALRPKVLPGCHHPGLLLSAHREPLWPVPAPRGPREVALPPLGCRPSFCWEGRRNYNLGGKVTFMKFANARPNVEITLKRPPKTRTPVGTPRPGGACVRSGEGAARFVLKPMPLSPVSPRC